MKISNLEQLKAWDLRWPTHEPGPWELSPIGIHRALGTNSLAIGVYWIGYAPHVTHGSFEPKYCGKESRNNYLVNFR